MMNKNNANVYVVWTVFQRRAQSLGAMLDMDVRYYHYAWEEKGKVFKAMAHLMKFAATLRDLLRLRPRVVMLQLAPTTLLYAAATYRLLTGASYVADCHNTMIYDDHWIRWPFARALLRRALVTIVHNTDVQREAERIGIPSTILRDPLPVMDVPEDVSQVADIDLDNTSYVIIPGSMAPDEPIGELFEAAASTPDMLFVMTWYAHKLPEAFRGKAPENIRFTGFLDEPEFNALYAKANVAIVLTTREGTQPSGASEAIALGVPLVVSDIATTRRLYGDAPVYVDNSASSIASGVKQAVEAHDEVAARVASLRDDLRNEAQRQVDELKTRIDGVDRD